VPDATCLLKTQGNLACRLLAGVRGGIALIAVDGPNRAAAALVFGDYLGLVRGGKRDTLKPGNMFDISGRGPRLSGRAPPPT
jgi:hypothetical protein